MGKQLAEILRWRPRFTAEKAVECVTQRFGMRVTDVRELPSERDQNFLIAAGPGKRFVLKIANASETGAFLDAQNALLDHVAQRCEVTPTVLAGIDGQAIQWVNRAEQHGGDHAEEVHSGKQQHAVRLVEFLDGTPLAEMRFKPPELLFDLGQTTAKLTDALDGFEHDAFHYSFHWDLVNAVDEIEERLFLVADRPHREALETLVDAYKKFTQPILPGLPKSIIHNDLNDGNIVVGQASSGHGLPQSITGVFDFGDAIYSWTIVDLAVAIAYAITDSLDPVQDICQIAKGYDQVRSLSEHELTALFGLVCIRLCLSVAIAAEQSAAEPDNAYLNCSQAGIERLLPRLAAIPFPIARSMLRTALGREEDLHESSVLAWIDANQSNFAFPLAESNISPERAHRFVVLDLSVDSDIIPREIDGITEPTLTRSIDEAMLSADARIGVGRYLEPRLLYSAGQFSSLGLEQENRTIHLGIDLFAPAGTPVVAPLAGQVAYVGNIDLPLDYGGLLILSHETPGGQTFFTLYGHLDPTSLSALERGDDVELGTHIAELGAADCNGGWAPHLHFQLLLDDFDLLERFPGVALASQSRQWSQYSADPNRILGIDPSLFPPVPPTKAETRRRRKAVTGRNLSIGYSHPLKMIRGWKQYLYDETGRRFLDAYNNVPHVGHCHPRVVDAITRQARMLNTNTRYLHDNFNRLAERITETMPPGLDVCFLVNSASEANELAIRIARAATHARATIVLEGAYHGHTNTLIDLSPYKHDGRGGEGRPDWVYTAELPDLNRGRFTDPSDAGVRYADSVQRCIQEILEKDSQGLSGFLCESCPSVAGQIILPPNYLSEVYKLVRQAGGICIADEVQTGYGRLGNAMYGFELQDVVPDLVILGKPIGNGHPLAAVVTTREIADAFDTGMEYFSTFGGNPVSCAAGLAVLDVLEQEDLQANAQAVGDFLLSGLNQLAERVDPIDDVRGQGFFLGVELTRGDDRSPDAEAASFIANRMRDRGVLIGTDGIADNVLKIRPPMCFSLDDAKRLLHQLSESFLDLGY